MKPRTFVFDRLQVHVYPDRAAMGTAAANHAAEILRLVIGHRGSARIILGSAPSQDELIAGLAAAPGINWNCITLFHMDEYVGLPATHSASFRHYQQQHLLTRVTPAVFHGIHGESADPAAECARYSALLTAAPIDLVCLGIGENGHIAFNDPPVADFDDPCVVKIVSLDEVCRQQQVNDGCFPNIEAVPRQAITLTCPALMAGRALVCTVPGPRKAAAVAAALLSKISTACPASILREHPGAELFMDAAAAAKFAPNV